MVVHQHLGLGADTSANIKIVGVNDICVIAAQHRIASLFLLPLVYSSRKKIASITEQNFTKITKPRQNCGIILFTVPVL
jgi:hypothetical protein